MQAMVIESYGDPEKLVLREVPKPKPDVSEILIKIRAFGLNHADTYMRRGVWENTVPIIGIECVGQVEHDPSGVLQNGTTVATIMGGMGRTRNGSYAEYTSVLATNVFALKTKMAWEDLAALPESYATAWACLFENLRLAEAKGDSILLVRGATSGLGQAALNIAAAKGITVWGTTRSSAKESFLQSIGAKRVLIETNELSKTTRALRPDGIDYVLDLIGNSAFAESTRMVRKGGRVCVAGWLGGFEAMPFDVLDLQPGVDVSLFVSSTFGSKDYPLSRIPMQKIVEHAEAGLYKTKPARVFKFRELAEAHRLMEANGANGKLVAVTDG
jgi:NADPH:quinone reductase-like Zn-dependent oxidoreductase